MYDMFEMMSPSLVAEAEPPEVNAFATLPMIRETEGRMAPAQMAEIEPMKRSSLS